MVIFDLDGVLVDACEWHRIALNEALKEICGYKISLEDHYKVYNGIPTRKKLEILTSKKLVTLEQHELVYKSKQKKTIEIINKNATIRPEKQEIIKYLKESGIIVACYTNSIRKTATLMLEKTGILEMFEYILTNQDVTHPKPDPEGYNFLMKHFSISPARTLIFEDSPKGLAAAKSSGANVIQVSGPEEVNLKLIKECLR